MFSYELKRSSRTTISIRIRPDQTILVWAPYLTSQKVIHDFVISKTEWIKKSLEKVKNYKQLPQQDITKTMKDQALIQILPRIEYYAELMSLQTKYKKVNITTAKTKRWSCSSTWNLMFHRRLSELPIFILDYVVVHELAHLIHFNHSKQFWELVAIYCPDYKSTKKWLKENGHHRSIS